MPETLCEKLQETAGLALCLQPAALWVFFLDFPRLEGDANKAYPSLLIGFLF